MFSPQAKDDEQRKRLFKIFGIDEEFGIIEIKKKLVYLAQIYITPKCPHCCALTGMIINTNLTTLFVEDSPLKRVLIKNNWVLSELQIPLTSIYNSEAGTTKREQSGIAYIQKTYIPHIELYKYYRIIGRNYTDFLYEKINRLIDYINHGVNLCIEKIYFYDVKKIPELMADVYADATPVIATPFTSGGEKALSEDTPDEELEKMMFLSKDYNVFRHKKYLKGEKADWSDILRRRVRHQ